MDASVAIHPLEHTELVGVLGRFWKELGNLQSALAMLSEFVSGTGMWFFTGLRFVIEGVHLRGAAAHAEEDDPLGARADRWHLC